MDIDTKILLVRIGAAIALVGLCYVSWWMDYRWKRGPQGVGFYKSNGQGVNEKYDPNA